MDETDAKTTFRKEWKFPHHPVINLNKPDTVRLVFNAASNNKGVFMKNKLLAELNYYMEWLKEYSDFVTHWLYCKRQKNQGFASASSEQEKSCLRFLWLKNIFQKLKNIFNNTEISVLCLKRSVLQLALRENEPSEDATGRQGKLNNFWNWVLWTILRCCSRHSGE